MCIRDSNIGGEAYSGHNYYEEGTLFKNVVKDENWTTGLLHTTEEYKDIQGNVVLKRSYVTVGSTITPVETYYVYDDFGLLRYVLPPEAKHNLGTATVLTPLCDLVEKWCYYYEYYAYKRMIIKQLPSAEPMYMVYDNRDRLVATQDGNMRNDSIWLFTKYDTLNRPVITGVYNPGTNLSLSQMQTRVNTYYSNSTNLYCTYRTNTSAYMGYENVSFPDVNISLYYTATYYGDYGYYGVKSFNISESISDYTNGSLRYFNNPNTLVTGTKALVLDGNNNTYLFSSTYYDDKYRPIQVIRDLYGSSGATETTSNKYNFTGNVLETKISQTFDNVTTTVNKYYTYDHIGRLLKSEQSIVGVNYGAKVTLSEMDYNELGYLKQKRLGVSNSVPLSAIDYKYNIRGWLTDINNTAKLKGNLFAMSLYYNISGVNPLTTSPQYNGNISGIKWKSGQPATADTVLKAYGFVYDELNRLKASYYGQGADLTIYANRFNESIGNYDLNGNIMSLYRHGVDSSIYYNNFDSLTY